MHARGPPRKVSMWPHTPGMLETESGGLSHLSGLEKVGCQLGHKLNTRHRKERTETRAHPRPKSPSTGSTLG